jgi:hypothetical protein
LFSAKNLAGQAGLTGLPRSLCHQDTKALKIFFFFQFSDKIDKT